MMKTFSLGITEVYHASKSLSPIVVQCNNKISDDDIKNMIKNAIRNHKSKLQHLIKKS